ncbi:chemotaxis protein CheW [bacterium]|nr:chemotaxis protein CheW [bacterium]
MAGPFQATTAGAKAVSRRVVGPGACRQPATGCQPPEFVWPPTRGLINLRGQIVTALDLRRRLDLPDRPDGDPPVNVVVRTDDGAVSLLVDEIGDVLDVPEAAFERSPETLAGPARGLIRGAYKLDGRLLLILDTDRAVDLADARAPD